MSYQDELRELASKRIKRNHRTRMIMLVISLVVVLFVIQYLGTDGKKIGSKANQLKSKTTQEQTQAQENANK